MTAKILSFPVSIVELHRAIEILRALVERRIADPTPIPDAPVLFDVIRWATEVKRYAEYIIGSGDRTSRARLAHGVARNCLRLIRRAMVLEVQEHTLRRVLSRIQYGHGGEQCL